MLLHLDSGSGRPLYAQIVEGVRSAIDSGELAVGERLPAARELALVLGVNMHTVLHAYAVLREDGVIHLRRARGAVVAEPSRSRLQDLVAAVAREARRHGLSQDEVSALIAAEARG